MASQTKLHAIAFRDGDTWIIQGIEYDITAHASNQEGIADAFMRALAHNCFVSEHTHGEPFAGIQAAPARYRDMFERARDRISSVEEPSSKPKAVNDVEVRLLATA
jgi:hypothetical protein